MTVIGNPALAAFDAALPDALVMAQVVIQRQGRGFVLCHVTDREKTLNALRSVGVAELRALAQATETGAFRPLKSAPNLAAGWACHAPNAALLGEALEALYPGAVADWFAARSAGPPVTHYREFTSRQTGMYRVTQLLEAAAVSHVITACCGAAFCLKQRLWTVEGHPTDAAGEKSIIPCLEPCPVFMELARTAWRLEQSRDVTLKVSPRDLETMRAALAGALEHPKFGEREADFSSPTNPRRLALLLAKLPQPEETSSTAAAEQGTAGPLIK